ncbi:WD40/YVTN/BNR-like repeat-containing protein [Gemmatimonadota bacterium]
MSGVPSVRVVAWCAALLLIMVFPCLGSAQSGLIDPSLIEVMSIRNIGPANLGGRIHDVEVHPDHPATIWVGHAAGGVFRSVNNGTTWEAVFDDQVSTSIGDIAIAPANPSIVYVGTGEQNNRQSSSWGNGMYKTMDGGVTWQHIGLENTHHIGKIKVHPADPDIVWVAAVGHLWGPNDERGVFMTTDGGATWTKTLFINEDTGVIDIAVDTESPNILYAAAYQRRRTGFGFNGGGPHGGIYRSTDSGRTWQKLTKGLPTGEVGRIGLDICLSDTDVVYAIIESRDTAENHVVGGQEQERASLGGVYRSDDKGETWTHQCVENPRPMYYSHIRVDPNNDLRVWVLDTQIYVSEDGAITWDTGFVGGIHVDHHALWWDPSDSDHIIVGNDGGLDWTYDGGETWVDMQTVPWSQFYEISADNVEPFYHVMGGLQDNGTWYGNSGNYWRIGITNRDWMTINGGDGFYAVADPVDPDIVYAESQGGGRESA